MKFVYAKILYFCYSWLLWWWLRLLRMRRLRTLLIKPPLLLNIWPCRVEDILNAWIGTSVLLTFIALILKDFLWLKSPKRFCLIHRILLDFYLLIIIFFSLLLRLYVIFYLNLSREWATAVFLLLAYLRYQRLWLLL